MKNIKCLAAAAAGMIMAASLCACSALDVVKTASVQAFGEVLGAAEPVLSDGLWQLRSQDGAASLRWDGGRVEMAVDAAPFVKAGLNQSKLGSPADDSGLLFFGREFKANGGTGSTPIADFESLMNTGRDNLEFHAAMDHFNLLVDGGMFMWAKDMLKNDSSGKDQQHDIAFVVDPEPLVAAGVDPSKVEGWAYLPLSLSVDGRMIPVNMFMKSVNLI